MGGMTAAEGDPVDGVSAGWSRLKAARLKLKAARTCSFFFFWRGGGACLGGSYKMPSHDGFRQISCLFCCCNFSCRHPLDQARKTKKTFNKFTMAFPKWFAGMTSRGSLMRTNKNQQTTNHCIIKSVVLNPSHWKAFPTVSCQWVPKKWERHLKSALAAGT